MTLERIEALCRELREDTQHGASQLAQIALNGLGELAGDLAAEASGTEEFLARLAHAERQVADARPAMAAIANGCARLFHAVHREITANGVSLSEAGGVVQRSATELVDAASRAVAQIATEARSALRSFDTLITLSESSTVLATLAAIAAERRIRVIVAESRPLLEGRNTVSRAAEFGLDGVLIPDAGIGRHSSDADAAISGADTLLPDGSVVNKAGTHLLALAAHRARVPFFVLCESQKLGVASQPGWMSEQGAASCVWESPPTGVTVWNYTFDCTPAELVTRVLTEEGPKPPAEIERLSRKAAERWALLCRWGNGDRG